MKIPDLFSYLRAQLPTATPNSRQKATRTEHLSAAIPWLFPEEINQFEASNVLCDGYVQQIEALTQKADMINADEGGIDKEKQRMTDVPIGLKNRWRIWKILNGINLQTNDLEMTVKTPPIQ